MMCKLDLSSDIIFPNTDILTHHIRVICIMTFSPRSKGHPIWKSYSVPRKVQYCRPMGDIFTCPKKRGHIGDRVLKALSRSGVDKMDTFLTIFTSSLEGTKTEIPFRKCEPVTKTWAHRGPFWKNFQFRGRYETFWQFLPVPWKARKRGSYFENVNQLRNRGPIEDISEKFSSFGIGTKRQI